MLLLLGFAFISGLVTILAPCIWPLLPLILSSTVTGGKRKPLGITLGILLSFGVLTLTLSYIVKIFSFDPDSLRIFAVVVIGFLGLTLIIPQLTALLEGYVSRFSGKLGSQNMQEKDGLWGGFTTGAVLGIIWTPCAGPILATIATLAATTSVNAQIIFVTIAYLIGVGIPLFFFATFGQNFFTKSRAVSPYTARIQQVFGVIMVLTAISIFTGYDKVLQAKLLDFFPQYSQALTAFESNSVVKDQLNKIQGREAGSSLFRADGSDLPSSENAPQAPEFTGIVNWMNTDTFETTPAATNTANSDDSTAQPLQAGSSQPLTMAGLKGKVVLIDFWTYTCINCIRTLPYLTKWHETYAAQGLVIVGVHTPEFEFEKDAANVQGAIERYGIKYPVAQDNDFATWNAYSNRYWPAKYLIDANGKVRYTHFGEGKYEETEKMIQKLLEEAGTEVSGELAATAVSAATPQQLGLRRRISPETYLGSKRMLYLVQAGKANNGTQNFTLAAPDSIAPDKFSLGGTWTISDEFSASVKDSTLRYNFTAKNVYLVLQQGSAQNGTIKVYVDGKLVDERTAGKDVVNGTVTVTEDRLYDLVDLRGQTGTHLLELVFETPGVEAYAFTFG